ncbi:MAG TPA: MFS transporter [Sphingomonas sp.]|nr:MFS transporter [Sphingomonas sp.]
MLSLCEGIDLASMGVALPQISLALGLDPRQAGAVASASMLGIVFGSVIFGRLADVYGQRRVMVAAGLCLGLFCAATPSAWDFRSLLVIRLFAGLGMGGLLPIIIAMAASATDRARATAISLVMGIGPIGGILAGVLALTTGWQSIFWVGGAAPLVFIGLALLRDFSDGSPRAAVPSPVPVSTTLFGEGRAAGTALIWLAAFCSVMANYIIINWLPSLLVGAGWADRESKVALMTYSAGCVAGNLLVGRLLERNHLRGAAALAYGGAAVLVVAIAHSASVALFPIVFATAVCIIGGQLITIVLTPAFYPENCRTLTLGATFSVGRIGAAVGPLLIGQLLLIGLPSTSAILALVPVLAVALLATLFLFPLVASVGRSGARAGKPIESLGSAIDAPPV